MAHNGNSSNHDAANAGDVQQMAMQNLSQGINAMANQQYKKGEETTANILGMEMDKGLVNLITTFYTGFGKQINDYLAPRIYDGVIAFAPSVKKISGIELQGKNLHRTAAGATLAVTLGGFLLPDVSLFVSAVRKHYDDAAQLRRRLAPVLDDRYGSHSAGTFNSIRVEGTDKKPGNSVIVAHRRRMHKENSHETTNIILTALGKNLLNFYHARGTIEALHTGDHLTEVTKRHDKDLSEKYTEEVSSEFEKKGRSEEYKQKYLANEVANRIRKEKNGGNSSIGWFGGGAVLTQFVQAFTKSSDRRMEATRQPYSALEMILALEEQVQNNPGGATRFALPHARGESRGRELPIEQYVAEIFEHHMREMADFDPHYTEIRDALKNDLKEVTRPIADAIKDGDLNPQMLVRLVGEGMVVKNKGHGLASVDEVKELLEKYASKSQSFAVADPKKYVAERNFTLEHVKDALKGLEGEERIHYAATLPDQLLRMAGMSDSDIHTVQEQRARTAHDVFLMQETLGVDATPDEELREAGLGTTQIKRLHKDAEMIREGGEKAMHKLKAGPTNPDGIEHILNDVVTPKIAGDKQYMGKLLEVGREALENPAEAANDHDGDTRQPRSHAERVKAKTPHDHANDNHGRAANDYDYDDEMSHAERLTAQRGHGHGHSKAFD